MTVAEVEVGDKVARMVRGQPLVMAEVVGKDEHGPPRIGPVLYLRMAGGATVTLLAKECEDWKVLGG